MKYRRSLVCSRKGFTLVELIVVLVILAILAAMLVPSLLGYIEKAREKEDMLKAKNCLTAAQALFTKNYASRSTTDKKAVKAEANVSYTGKAENGEGRDIYMNGSQQSAEILSTAGDNPYVFIVGAGDYHTYADGGTDIHKAYTILFAIYKEKADSKPIFFDGKEWTNEYPWFAKGDKAGNDNIFEINGEATKLSLYVICDSYGNEKTMWNQLQKDLN